MKSGANDLHYLGSLAQEYGDRQGDSRSAPARAYLQPDAAVFVDQAVRYSRAERKVRIARRSPIASPATRLAIAAAWASALRGTCRQVHGTTLSTRRRTGLRRTTQRA